MKKSILVFSLMLSCTSAFAAQSCLTKEEGKSLFELRMKLAQAKINRPDCKNAWGGAGCLPPSELTQISYYEAKENGDIDACGMREEVTSSNIE